MKKLLSYISAAVIALCAATSCSGDGSSSSDEKEKEAPVDSLSYLMGKSNGAAYRQNFDEMSDSTSSDFDQFLKGNEDALKIDTTSLAKLRGTIAGTEIISSYNGSPMKETTPINFTTFMESFKEGFYTENPKEDETKTLYDEFSQLNEKAQTATAEERKQLAEQISALYGKGIGLQYRNLLENFNAATTGVKLDKDEFANAFIAAGSLADKSDDYCSGYLYGVTALDGFSNFAGQGVMLDVASYKKGFEEGVKNPLTPEEANNLRADVMSKLSALKASKQQSGTKE